MEGLSPMNKSESKYFNTAIKMDEAFLSLIEVKDFEYITVKEICSKAGVNRATFYLHYETVADLLEETTQYMHRKFIDTFSHKANDFPDIGNCSKDELMLINPEYLKPYLTFIKDNRKLYSAALEYPQIFQSDKTYQIMFQNIFSPILERFGIPANERQYHMLFFLNGIEGIILHWLNGDCSDSIENIIKIIETCVMGERKI